MCGIVGIITSYSNGFSYDEAKVFRDMLLIDTLRGFDSTGVFGVDYNSNVELLKEASNGASFVKTKEYNAFDSWLSRCGMFAVGHNRAATRGAINDKNAHPFVVEDNIVLVQNGTYKGDHSHHKDTEVDTEAIAHVLHENEDIEKALQKINAAYALVWYHVKTKTLNIIRNDERPLFIAYSSTGSVLFASEEETILAACSRNGLTLKSKPYLLKENTLNSWTIDDDKHTHSFNGTKINNKYVYTSTMVFPFHTNNYQTNFCSDNRRQFNYEKYTNNSKNTADDFSVSTTIYEYIHRGEFKQFMASTKEAEKCISNLNTSNKSLYVEFVDYKPCNNRPNCKAWYVIFNTIDPNDTVSPVIYSLITNKTETDIIKMNEDNSFYLVDKAAGAIEHSVVDENFERKRIVSLFVTNAQPAVIN